jgi:hypothetical protein
MASNVAKASDEFSLSSVPEAKEAVYRVAPYIALAASLQSLDLKRRASVLQRLAHGANEDDKSRRRR